MHSFNLNNGLAIPAIAFGTAAIGRWQQDDGYVKDVVLSGIESGYRHIDTASLYGNERSVGRAVAESGLGRESFFLTSKVWDTEQGYDATLEAFERSLVRLGTDYLDLYLVHWPYPDKTLDTWRAMETLYNDGRVKAIGLSNFRASDIDVILANCEIKPAYNQLELHPYFTQAELVEYSESRGMRVACWSPLGTGSWSSVSAEEKPIANPQLKAIAQVHGVGVGQVIIKWNLQRGRIVIPKSETLKNIQANLDVEGFALTEAELAQIEALDQHRRFGGDPNTALATNLKMVVPD